tara:strand:- start:429 stop:578 length:150 start_codon:yes stop_codon:yes gene_type:complete
MNINDTTKLNIKNDIIHYKIRQQDGSFVSTTTPDTPNMRRFVQWVQIHD